MKLRELKGIKSLRALNGFHALMLGLKMLPAYAGESYEDFYDRAHGMPPADQEKLIREAVLFVELKADEVEAMCCFAEDANGVPYTGKLVNISPAELVEIIVAVCKEIIKIPIDLVTESEKKN